MPIGGLKSTTHHSAFDKKYNNPDTGLDNIMESWVLDEKLSSPILAGRLAQFNIGADIEIANLEGNKITSGTVKTFMKTESISMKTRQGSEE